MTGMSSATTLPVTLRDKEGRGKKRKKEGGLRTGTSGSSISRDRNVGGETV